MRAMAIEKFGGPEELKLMDLPPPPVGPGEILLKVKAAGINPVDWKIRQGLLQGRLPYEFPIILGWDAAGLVETMGAGVTDYQKGDEVMAYCRRDKVHWGTYADFVVLTPENLARKPKNLTFAEAAVLPLSALTAFQSLFESLQIRKGETLLVPAGAGGVGGYAIQMARHHGCRVLSTASPKNHEAVRALGAEAVYDYHNPDYLQKIRSDYPEGIQAAFDTVGGETQKDLAQVLASGGRLTSVLALAEELKKNDRIRVDYVFVRPDPKQLEQICQWAEAGIVTPRIVATYPLESAGDGLKVSEAGHCSGKVAIII